ncbi:hypothetical protein D9M69_680980 [compost metagenome]
MGQGLALLGGGLLRLRLRPRIADRSDLVGASEDGRRRANGVVIFVLGGVRVELVAGIGETGLHQHSGEVRRALDGGGGHGLLRLGEHADVFDLQAHVLQLFRRRRNQRLAWHQAHPDRPRLLDHGVEGDLDHIVQ